MALAAAQVTPDRPWSLYCDHEGHPDDVVMLMRHAVFGGHVDEEFGPCRLSTGPEFDDHEAANVAVVAVNAAPLLLDVLEAAETVLSLDSSFNADGTTRYPALRAAVDRIVRARADR